MLRDGSVRTCLLAISSAGRQVRLDIRADDRRLASMEVAVRD